MNRTRIILSALLALLLSLCLAACTPPTVTPPSGESEPEVTAPAETELETEPETEPQETEPQETKPQETEPQETEPQETEPQETEPQETEPQETEPQETEPQETEPQETEPQETEPQETEIETEPETEPETEAHAHSFGAWTVTEEASCEKAGLRVRTCACGEEESEVIPTTGHSFGDWVVTAAPTCTEKGVETRACACGHTETREVAAKGHTYSSVVAAPTCTEKGYTTYACACGHSYVDNYVDAKGHTFGEWVVTTAPTCTEKGVETRACACGHTETREIAAKGHAEQILPAVDPTCTATGLTEGKSCSTCGEVLVAQTVLPSLGESGHTVVLDPAVVARGDRDGRTEGSHCSTCGEVLLAQTVIPAPGYTDPALYHDDYGYTYLGTLEKGAALQTLYSRIDAEASAFHSDASRDADGDNFVAHFSYAELGLSVEEAVSVWICYRNDHPLYYWISPTYATTSTDLYLVADPAYAKGSDRAAGNALLLSAIRTFIEGAIDETSPYLLALAFHDALILGADYAYEADGVTPESEDWAHSVMGVMTKGSGVCESYAKSFQLLLNYCGVENVLATGVAFGGSAWENHAWNLAQMEDGQWYWFDLTWDDQPEEFLGISYRYFCVTDTADVRRADGNAGNYTPATFVDTHIPSSASTGAGFLYMLPTRSASAFADDVLLTLRESFTADGLTYALVGYGQVQLIRAGVTGELSVPETVTHGGRAYSVVSIGAMDAEGYFGTWGSVIGAGGVTAITLPKSICFLWDNALGSPDGSLKSVTVHAENPCFDSLDGVLFTEGRHTLLLYPNARGSTTYAIPDETVFLAAYSFSQSANNTLTSLKLGASLREIGVCAGSRGYPEAGSVSYSFLRSGEWSLVFYSLTGGQSVTLSEANTALSIEGGLLYANGGTRVMGRVDRRIRTAVLADTVTAIDPLAFYGCSYLGTVFYEGDATAYAAISVGYQNDELAAANVLFYSETSAAGCWRYVDGVPTPW